MTPPEIYEKLTELFRDVFYNDDIVLKSDMTAADVPGWDSFTHISLMVAVETRFGIKLNTADLDKLANVGDLISAIEKKLPA
jgi:acyl carrier protein